MRVLILTCSTGGGHNACARALQEVFAENGHCCDFADSLAFVSDRLSRFMSWGHTTMYRHVPRLFDFGYGFAEKHPATLNDRAALYKLLTGGTGKLSERLREGQYDTVICTHVFSGLLLQETQKIYPVKLKTAFVATDYTCSPGAARSSLDYYFIPADGLKPEFMEQGVPAEKLVASGIPVCQAFYTALGKQQAKRQWGIDPSHTHLLMMCGSMGCGPMEKLAKLLSERMCSDMELSIVCGTNGKRKKELAEQFSGCPNIHIHGFVRDVSALLDSADLYLTKPGGLSTSEALTKCLPMVFVDAVAGCEEYNLNYFVSLGGAVTADTPEALAELCTELSNNPDRRSEMSERLLRASPGNAARQICQVLQEKDRTDTSISLEQKIRGGVIHNAKRTCYL